MKLSIIIPVYNEEKTLLKILEKIESVNLPLEKEIILIDDASTDGSKEILQSLKNKYKIIFQDENEGKGAAAKEGFLVASGEIVLIQDADLEYDPREYPFLLEPILEEKADVVFSRRIVKKYPGCNFYPLHSLANIFLTKFSNLLSGLKLKDTGSCYKVFKKEVINNLKYNFKSKRFGIDPEIVAKVAKGNWKISEVGVSYCSRSYKEGKKINWQDGLAAFWHIIRFNIFH